MTSLPEIEEQSAAPYATEPAQWTECRIQVPIQVGEIRLLRPTFHGLEWRPDIFDIVPLSRPLSPYSVMRAHRVQLARIYSCPLTENYPSMSREGGFVCVVDSCYRHFYVETRGSFADYLSCRNKKTVATLKRKVRKVEEMGDGREFFQVYVSPSELREFLQAAHPISEKSYQERLMHQGLPKTKEFEESVITQAADRKILGYILWIAGVPAAYTLCPIYGGKKALYDYTGYDPAFAPHSPGTVLQFKIIEDLFARPNVDFYDLCTGEGMHKEIFATGSILCGNLYFFKSISTAAVAVAARRTFSAASRSVIKLLTTTRLKSGFKKLIRRSA